MITLIAASQWIVGAKIGYNIGEVHYKYYMYIEEDLYMSFVVPGVILFYIGLNLIDNQLSLSSVSIYIESNRGIVLRNTRIISIVGLFSFALTKSINIPQLAFILYLSNLLIYVSIAHYMYLFPQKKYRIFLVSLLFMFVLSLQSGLFHNFIIVASFLAFFLFAEHTSFLRKMALISIGFASLYAIQLVKSEYRAIIWESQGDVGVFSAFFTVLEQEFFPQTSFVTNTLDAKGDLEERSDVNSRLNQGWIISKVMDNIPKNRDYFEGSTVIESIESAILPRLLFPNKKGADQAIVNFKNMSGLQLNEGTSMGLSVIGEFYGNYGVVGGWVAMFLYGLILAISIKFIISVLGYNSPLILLWLLLFFFQVVKAETELMKVVNHLVKSILFFVALRFVLSLFNIELFQRSKTIGKV